MNSSLEAQSLSYLVSTFLEVHPFGVGGGVDGPGFRLECEKEKDCLSSQLRGTDTQLKATSHPDEGKEGDLGQSSERNRALL